eukprot:Hpha_TRINITY_DN16409_c0_g6::TRINITY_DN16409_c0_g6_i1::g.162693::m.162693/K10866/RAD50; DNA repair protein RAD50
MSSCIEQLSVTGVRSFDPDPTERQHVVFHKPVTFIVGPNGSGKTTIIEAIRNACTGDLPGQGRAFVHDPKVLGTMDVKAQIRMQFRGANGQQYLVNRSFQLTQKAAGAQKFETLDAHLQSRDPRSGNVVSQSLRGGELDRVIPELMGVSKAVLDNVVFLHQDEANWPLADPATLKKKFDDIFSAARYTKALEDIRKVVKDMREQVRQHSAAVSTLGEARASAQTLRQGCETDQGKLQELQARSDELQGRLSSVEHRWADANAKSQALQQQESQLLLAEGEVKALNAETARAEALLEPKATDSDEQLHSLVARFEEVVKDYRRREHELGAQVQAAQADCRALERKMSELTSERTVLTAQSDSHQRRVADLQSIMSGAAQRYGIQVPGGIGGGVFDQAAVLAFHDAFRAKVEQVKAQRDEVRAEVRRTQEVIERELTDARSRREQFSAQRAAAQRQNDAAKPRIRELQQRYKDLEPAVHEQSEAQGRVTDLERKIEAEHKSATALQQRASGLAAKYDTLSSRAQVLGNEAFARKDEAEAAHRLRLLREEQERCKKESTDTRARVEGRFTQLMGRKLNPAALYEEVASAVQAKQAAVERVQQEVMGADRELAVLRQQLREIAERSAELRRQAEQKETKFLGLTTQHKKPVPELLTEAERLEEKQRHSLDVIKAFDKCHLTFVRQAEEASCCPICDRGLVATELAHLKKHVRNNTKDVANTVRVKEEALRQAKELVTAVLAMVPLHRDVDRIRTDELPRLERQRQEAAEKAEARAGVLRDLQAKVEGLRFEERECRSLMQEGERIRELNKGITQAGERILEDERKLAAARGSGARALDLVQGEMETVNKERESVSAEQQRLMREDAELRQRLGELGSLLSAAQRTVTEKRARVDERQRLRKEYEEVMDQFKRMQNDASEQQSRLPEIEANVERLQRDLTAAREKGDRKEAEITATVEGHQGELSRITASVEEVRKHVEERRAERLEAVVNAVGAAQKDLHAKEASLRQAQEDLTGIQKQANNNEVLRHNLEANIAFRRKRQEAAAKSKEIERLRQRLREESGGMQGGLVAMLNQISAEKGKLDSEMAGYRGQMEATRRWIQERESELSTTRFEKIDERYASALIRLQSAKLAEDDMQRYHSVLDKALMNYHDEKIADVNEIVKDLWRRTYRGQDIDHIELRSDVVQDGAAKRRSYNYRVVMIKGGVPLDMKGRCSAGQRVLASLVIRIALSQAFGCECGMLALDEPTMNLDSDNIQSLGQALVDLIQSAQGGGERGRPSNFQLIIITHDEQFVRDVGSACGTESVIHVSKDGEGQYTRIATRSIHELLL